MCTSLVATRYYNISLGSALSISLLIASINVLDPAFCLTKITKIDKSHQLVMRLSKEGNHVLFLLCYNS